MPSRSSAVTVVIPARFGSSRFPGKPLAMLLGKPLIQHVYEHARSSRGVGQVLIATDDSRIAEAVKGFDGTVVMTTGPFRTGTDRVAAVARQVTGQTLVNLQGDEILLHPELIPDLVTPFLESGAGMGTLKRRLTSPDDVRNPAVVKVVTDRIGDALYFSREPIPHRRDHQAGGREPGLYYMHLGMYIYVRETLLRLAELPTGPLEEAEQPQQGLACVDVHAEMHVIQPGLSSTGLVVPPVRNGLTRKIERVTGAVRHDLHDGRIPHVVRRGQSPLQRPHPRPALQKGGDQIRDQLRVEEDLVTLEIHQGLACHLSRHGCHPIGPGPERTGGHDDRSVKPLDRLGNTGVVGGDQHLANAPRGPRVLVDVLDERLAEQHGQGLCRKPRRPEPGRDDNRDRGTATRHASVPPRAGARSPRRCQPPRPRSRLRDSRAPPHPGWRPRSPGQAPGCPPPYRRRR